MAIAPLPPKNWDLNGGLSIPHCRASYEENHEVLLSHGSGGGIELVQEPPSGVEGGCQVKRSVSPGQKEVRKADVEAPQGQKMGRCPCGGGQWVASQKGTSYTRRAARKVCLRPSKGVGLGFPFTPGANPRKKVGACTCGGEDKTGQG